MQIRDYLIGGVCLVALCLGAARAADLDALFSAETIVTDEGSETRNTALSELLATVLVRISGNASVAGQPAAHDLLERAPSLVQQYRYRTADRGGEVVRYLWARFDRPVVERMMRERNLPVWVQRPRVLLWLAEERAGRRGLLNLDSLPQARAAVLARAAQRGMPLQLPLLDLEDQSRLTPADVWSDYRDGIRAASARYPHQATLTGRLRAQPGGARWSGVWTLIEADASQTFQTPAQGLAETLGFAIDQAQNLLAARHAPLPGGPGRRGTLVRFSDVYDLAAYGRLVAILGQLEAIDQAALRHVAQDSFVFDLQPRDSEQDLVRALNTSGAFAAEPVTAAPVFVDARGGAVPAAASAGPEIDLSFRLLN